MIENILKITMFITGIIYFLAMIEANSFIMTKKANKHLTIIVVLLSSIVFIAINNIYMPGYIVYIISYIYMILFFSLLFKGRTIDILFSAGNAILHLAGIGLIVFCLIRGVFGAEIDAILQNKIFNYVYAIIRWVICSVIAQVFVIKYKNLKEIWLTEFSINIIYKIQTMLNILIIGYAAFYSLPMGVDKYEWVMVIILMLFIYYITIKYTITYDSYIDTRVKNGLLEEQMNKQVAYYEIQKEHIDRLRKFKHDYKHMMEGMAYLINKEDVNGLKFFVEEMDIEMREVIENYKEYSNHWLIQAILWDAQEKIKKLNIQFEAYIYIPESVVLTDLEICRVFLNIIENCIEACEKVSNIKRRFINIETVNKNNGVIIKVENALNEKVIIGNNHFMTTKDNHFEHGLGMKNIKDIIEKHGGVVSSEINQKSKKFILKLYLPYKLNM